MRVVMVYKQIAVSILVVCLMILNTCYSSQSTSTTTNTRSLYEQAYWHYVLEKPVVSFNNFVQDITIIEHNFTVNNNYNAFSAIRDYIAQTMANKNTGVTCQKIGQQGHSTTVSVSEQELTEALALLERIFEHHHIRITRMEDVSKVVIFCWLRAIEQHNPEHQPSGIDNILNSDPIKIMQLISLTRVSGTMAYSFGKELIVWVMLHPGAAIIIFGVTGVAAALLYVYKKSQKEKKSLEPKKNN
jgi:hypothetical protein